MDSLPIDTTNPASTLINLSYVERQRLARRVGRLSLTDARARNLIDELLKGSQEEAVCVDEVNGKDELVSVLPVSARDISTHHLTQFSVTAAVASTSHVNQLREEFASPSGLMDRMCARALSKRDSTQHLSVLILESPPRPQRTLISQCIKHKRTDVLDTTLPQLLSRVGVRGVAPYIHGCSSPVLHQTLTAHSNELLSQDCRVKWFSVARYHPDVFIAVLLEGPLTSTHVLSRGKVWAKFTTWNTAMGSRGRTPWGELLHRGGGGPKVLELLRRLPWYTQRVDSPRDLSPSEETLTNPTSVDYRHYAPALPTLVEDHLNHFAGLSGTSVWDVIAESMRVDAEGQIQSAAPFDITSCSRLSGVVKVLSRAIQLTSHDEHTRPCDGDISHIHRRKCRYARSLWGMTVADKNLHALFTTSLHHILSSINAPLVSQVVSMLLSHTADVGPVCGSLTEIEPDTSRPAKRGSAVVQKPTGPLALTYEREQDGVRWRYTVDLAEVVVGARWSESGEHREPVCVDPIACVSKWRNQTHQLINTIHKTARQIACDSMEGVDKDSAKLPNHILIRLKGLVVTSLSLIHQKLGDGLLSDCFECSDHRLDSAAVSDLAQIYLEVSMVCSSLAGVPVGSSSQPSTLATSQYSPSRETVRVVKALGHLVSSGACADSVLRAWRSVGLSQLQTQSGNTQKRQTEALVALQGLLETIRLRVASLTTSVNRRWTGHVTAWGKALEFVGTAINEPQLFREFVGKVQEWVLPYQSPSMSPSVTAAISFEASLEHVMFHGQRIELGSRVYIVQGTVVDTREITRVQVGKPAQGGHSRHSRHGSSHSDINEVDVRHPDLHRPVLAEFLPSAAVAVRDGILQDTLQSLLKCPEWGAKLPIPLSSISFDEHAAAMDEHVVSTVLPGILALVPRSESSKPEFPLSLVGVSSQKIAKLSEPSLRLKVAFDSRQKLLTDMISEFYSQSDQASTSALIAALDHLSNLPLISQPDKHLPWCEECEDSACYRALRASTEDSLMRLSAQLVEVVLSTIRKTHSVAIDAAKICKATASLLGDSVNPVQRGDGLEAGEEDDTLVAALIEALESDMSADRLTNLKAATFDGHVHRFTDWQKVRLEKAVAAMEETSSTLAKDLARTVEGTLDMVGSALFNCTKVYKVFAFSHIANFMLGLRDILQGSPLIKRVGLALGRACAHSLQQTLNHEPSVLDSALYRQVFTAVVESVRAEQLALFALLGVVPDAAETRRIARELLDSLKSGRLAPSGNVSEAVWREKLCDLVFLEGIEVPSSLPIEHRSACWIAALELVFEFAMVPLATKDEDADMIALDASSSISSGCEAAILLVIRNISSVPTGEVLECLVSTVLACSDDVAEHLAAHHPDTLLEMMEAVCGWKGTDRHTRPLATTLSQCTQAAASLCFPPANETSVLSSDYRDKLSAFLDVSDHSIRKTLTRLADSNSVSQRMAAIETLLRATSITHLDNRDMQITRTLRFLMGKIKNETFENRSEVMGNIVKHLGVSCVEATEDAAWLMREVLQDALESPDLESDSMPSTAFFTALERLWVLCFERAMECGANTESGVRLLRFVVDSGFAVSQYHNGNRQCRETFSPLGICTSSERIKFLIGLSDSKPDLQRAADRTRELLDVVGTQYVKVLRDGVSLVVQDPHTKTGKEDGEEEWMVVDGAKGTVEPMQLDWASDVPLHVVEHVGKALGQELTKCGQLIEIITARVATLESALNGNGDSAPGCLSLRVHPSGEWPRVDVLTPHPTHNGFQGSAYAIVAVDSEPGSWAVMCGSFECVARSSHPSQHPWEVDVWVSASGTPVSVLLEPSCASSVWTTDPITVAGADLAVMCEWMMDSTPWWENSAFHSIVSIMTRLIRSLRVSGGVFAALDGNAPVQQSLMMTAANLIHRVLQHMTTLCRNGDEAGACHLWDECEVVRGLLDESLAVLSVCTSKPGRIAEQSTKRRKQFVCVSPAHTSFPEIVLCAWQSLCLPLLMGNKTRTPLDSMQDYEQRFPFAVALLSALQRASLMVDVCSPWVEPPKLANSPTVLPSHLARFVLRAARNGWSWWECQPLADFTRDLLRQLRSAFPTDSAGHLSIERNDRRSPTAEVHILFPVQVFLTAIRNHTLPSILEKQREGEGRLGCQPEWVKSAVCREFVETMLQSRQAGTVLFPWLRAETAHLPTRERREALGVCLERLITIHPSAIYIKFVQRKLMRSYQHLLTRYLNSSTAILGPFYPDKHTSGMDAYPLLQQPITVEREVELATGLSKAGMPLIIQPFCLHLSYGLHRLTAEQCDSLRERWVTYVTNKDNPMSARSKTLAHATLLPNTTLRKIVELADGMSDSVKLLETAMRGAMRLHAVAPSMHYLLRPSILSSHRARILPTALQQCVPRLQPATLDTLFISLLGPVRRRALKVTAHKAVVRLIGSQPSKPTMVRLVAAEAGRVDIHRDVKIAALRIMLQWLCLPSEVSQATKTAWQALEKVATTRPESVDGAEAMVALLGVKPPQPGLNEESWGEPEEEVPEALVVQKRVVSHLKEFSSVRIPLHHAARYANRVIANLCATAMLPSREGDTFTVPEPTSHATAALIQNAKLRAVEDACDDVAAFGVAVLVEWVRFSPISCIETLANVVGITDPGLVYDSRADVREVRRSRWRHACSALSRLAHNATHRDRICDSIAHAGTALWEACKKHDMPLSEVPHGARSVEEMFGVRHELMHRVTSLLRGLNGPSLSASLIRSLPVTPDAVIAVHAVQCRQRLCAWDWGVGLTPAVKEVMERGNALTVTLRQELMGDIGDMDIDVDYEGGRKQAKGTRVSQSCSGIL